MPPHRGDGSWDCHGIQKGSRDEELRDRAKLQFPGGIKALAEHQPKQYQFHLNKRTFFDMAKVPEELRC